MRGTLIVDEGDFRFSDEKAELVKILSNGNGRGFPVLRSESVSGKEFSPRAYSVFGPKLIAPVAISKTGPGDPLSHRRDGRKESSATMCRSTWTPNIKRKR